MLQSAGGRCLGQGLHSARYEARYDAAATAAAKVQRAAAGGFFLVDGLLGCSESTRRSQRPDQGETDQLSDQNMGRFLRREGRHSKKSVLAGGQHAAFRDLHEKNCTCEYLLSTLECL